ncbi:MAG: sugar phosphate isomerase/epimerase [Verrucomicrobia bacterium]|nr:sugar phosphate isomerase/epimerase [Verrucomicrobiota bacterium]
MKFAICNETFKDWKLDDIFAYCAQIGYDAVEIAPFTLAKHVTDISAAERTRIRDAAARAGIAVSGIHWVLVQAEGMYLTSPEAATRGRTAKYFCDLVDFCADIGGRSIIVGSPKQRNLLPGVTPEQAWAWATEVFRPSVKRAEERSIVICFEPLAPSETNFVNTAEEGIRFAKQFSSRAMSVILDVKAMCSMGKPVPQIIRESRGSFAYFHANDANLKGPGFGNVDFVPIAAALKEVGYDGTVSVEVFNYDEGPEVIATKSLEYLKKCFA